MHKISSFLLLALFALSLHAQEEVPLIDSPTMFETYAPKREVGDRIYFRGRRESVPSPEEGDYLYYSSQANANFVGEVKKVSEEGVCTVRIFELKDRKKGALVATRNYGDGYMLKGRQTDYYPSGKVKRECTYSATGKLLSFVERDTLGNTVKKVEGRGKARKEWQYHTNGQLRKEKLGPGPKYDIHCFDKNGNPVRYLEGDLYVFDDGVYVISGTAPSYPGGIEAVQSYVDQHITIPQDLSDGDYLTVCSIHIADDGTVDDVRINQSSGSPELDDEIVRAIMQMPKWTPGQLKKWKFVQNRKDAKITIIRKRFAIPFTIYK